MRTKKLFEGLPLANIVTDMRNGQHTNTATVGKAWNRARSCLFDPSDEKEGRPCVSEACGSPSTADLAKAELEAVLHRRILQEG